MTAGKLRTADPMGCCSSSNVTVSLSGGEPRKLFEKGRVTTRERKFVCAIAKSCARWRDDASIARRNSGVPIGAIATMRVYVAPNARMRGIFGNHVISSG